MLIRVSRDSKKDGTSFWVHKLLNGQLVSAQSNPSIDAGAVADGLHIALAYTLVHADEKRIVRHQLIGVWSSSQESQPAS